MPRIFCRCRGHAAGPCAEEVAVLMGYGGRTSSSVYPEQKNMDEDVHAPYLLPMSRDFLHPDHEIEKHGAKLPHWKQDEVMQFVTFRLGDSLPQKVIRR